MKKQRVENINKKINMAASSADFHIWCICKNCDPSCNIATYI